MVKHHVNLNATKKTSDIIDELVTALFKFFGCL